MGAPPGWANLWVLIGLPPRWVITGVPSREFKLVRADELKTGVTCISFSTIKNFADDVDDKAAQLLPRVGPITVAMLLRNTLRLYRNFHA